MWVPLTFLPLLLEENLWESVSVADTLSSSIKVVSRAGVAEAERGGWPLAGTAHCTSQG